MASLTELLAQTKPGPVDEAHISIILRELLKGLEYLHSEFSSRFERKLILSFKQGVLIDEHEITNGVSMDSTAPTHYAPGAMVRYGTGPGSARTSCPS